MLQESLGERRRAPALFKTPWNPRRSMLLWSVVRLLFPETCFLSLLSWAVRTSASPRAFQSPHAQPRRHRRRLPGLPATVSTVRAVSAACPTSSSTRAASSPSSPGRHRQGHGQPGRACDRRGRRRHLRLRRPFRLTPCTTSASLFACASPAAQGDPRRQQGRRLAVAAAEFYELGFGEPWLISAAHGQGVNAVMDLAPRGLRGGARG